MAILTLDSLTGCNSIPSFMGGQSDTPSNPTLLIFRNTNAPTGWAKSTTDNDKALRVIGGANGTALSPGGTSPFLTVYASGKTYSGTSLGPAPVTITSGQGIGAYPTQASTYAPGAFAIGPHTTTSQSIAPHRHTHYINPSRATTIGPGPGPGLYVASGQGSSTLPNGSASVTSPTTHNHTGSVPNHTHPITAAQHTHTSTATHVHPFSISANFSINYHDVIVAYKS